MQKSIGKPMNRVDGPLKVTGRATYTAEHNIPNVAYGYLVMSTIAKGRVVSIETGSAERQPGVLAILTHENAPRLSQNAMQSAGGPATRKLQLLQDDRVLYANQPIAVVVAQTLEAAEESAHSVKVHYAVETPSVSLDHGQPYTPVKAGGGGDPSVKNRGDVAAGLAQADVKIEHVYSTPFETHNPMEPHATIAVWEGSDKLTLYDATQGIFVDRERVANLLGLQPDNVRVISLYLGGGFGSKGPTWSHVVLTAMAAKYVNGPVKLVLDRTQMFGSVGFRSHTRDTIALGAKRDGTLTAVKYDALDHTSSFDEFVEAAALPARMMYSSASDSTSHRLVRSDIGTPSYMRAPGEAPGSNTLEIAMDELAYALKMDPLELRLKNYADQDPDDNKPWSSKSLRECYQKGAEQFGWSRRKMEPRSMREGNVLIGWGLASAAYPTRRSASNARAQISSDGSILVESGTQDLGTGTYTVMTQVAADAIGVPASQVTFRLGDTDYPETPVSGGSQTAASTGSAVHAAGLALREKLVQLAVSDPASPLHGAASGDVVIEQGKLIVRGTSRGETLQTLLSRHGGRLEAEAGSKPGDEREHYSMYAFGAQYAEVRVDADLGQIKVLRMVGVFGAGRILNAKTARNQFIGGMVWGIGMALLEDTVYDPRLVRIVNNNLAEYHVPVNADVPAIEALWVDEVDTHVNPLGVKGIGEIGITGSAAAIANAVFHATGKRVRDYPITLDKVM